MWTRAVAVVVLAVCCASCLVKETESTLYLERDGSVTWTVVERNVRSDAESPEDRFREEADYLRSARWGVHSTRAAFDALWPASLDSVVLRDRRPFTVATTARFRGLDVLAQDFLDLLRLPGRASLEHSASSTRLVIAVDVRAAEGTDDDAASALEPLLDAVTELRVVLTAGRFVDASGFRIERDDVLALDEERLEALVEEGGDELALWIEWTEAE